jgi:uncharacterized protein YbaP (TraB family)
MKHFHFLLILFVLSSFFSLSQDKVTTEFPMKKSSLLWKIEGPGTPKGSYLFGTMHLIEKQYFIFPDKLEKLVKKSDQLVMELAGMPNQLEALNLVTLKEGSFFDYFTPEQTDTILRWAKSEMKMSEEGFRSTMSKMKPFVVVQMATQIRFMGKTESYEMTFEQIARENEITIKGLETIAQQMAIFDNLSNEQQTEMVMEGIRNMEKTLLQTERMQKLYVGQNVDSLYLMIQEEGGTIAEEMSEFLDKRNQNWVPQIKEMIQEKKTFIAVGAGHLGGPNGVIRLLEKEGYTLTPVDFN